jgi:hypothetical protein
MLTFASPPGSREITAFVLPDRRSLRSSRKAKEEPMKRSRRVVLTMMGSAAAGAVSMGLAPQRHCGPGETVVPGPDGRPYCRGASYGGFGGTLHHVNGHGHGHGHAGG